MANKRGAQLDKPEHGWSNLRVNVEGEEYVYPISYLTDIVSKLFIAMERYYATEDAGSVITVDAEGFEWKLVIPEYNDDIVIYTDFKVSGLPEFLRLDNMSMDYFLSQMLNNIREDITEWVSFYCEVRTDTLAEGVRKLSERIEKIYKLRDGT